MKLTDFEPTTYSCPEGDIRAVRVGVFWYGEARGPDGQWVEHARHCNSYVFAIGLTLAALGLDEPDHPDERTDHVDW